MTSRLSLILLHLFLFPLPNTAMKKPSPPTTRPPFSEASLLDSALSSGRDGKEEEKKIVSAVQVADSVPSGAHLYGHEDRFVRTFRKGKYVYGLLASPYTYCTVRYCAPYWSVTYCNLYTALSTTSKLTVSNRITPCLSDMIYRTIILTGIHACCTKANFRTSVIDMLAAQVCVWIMNLIPELGSCAFKLRALINWHSSQQSYDCNYASLLYVSYACTLHHPLSPTLTNSLTRLHLHLYSAPSLPTHTTLPHSPTNHPYSPTPPALTHLLILTHPYERTYVRTPAGPTRTPGCPPAPPSSPRTHSHFPACVGQ